jgi:hypothetical protein
MIGRTFIAVLVWASMGGSAAWAQGNDWAAVMDLRPGTTIGILINLGRAGERNPHRVCRVLGTAAEGIECAVLKTDQEWIQEFARDQLAEVHLESVRVNRTYWGALIGGLIGGGLFAAAVAGEGGGRAAAGYFVYGGAIGAAIGAQAGPGRALKTKHGPVLYRAPSFQVKSRVAH